MNALTNLQKVARPSVFWREILPWFRWAIVLIGLAIGVSVWFTGWTAALPMILLFFLASSGTSALIVKGLVIGLLLLSAFISLVLIPWLTFIVIFWISNVVVTMSESASFADFIFRK